MPIIKHPIHSMVNGSVMFTAEIESDANAHDSVKRGLAVLWAISNGANLSYANLEGANLEGANLEDANLEGANLIHGGTRSDGYGFVALMRDGDLWVLAGCRYFTISEAHQHWRRSRAGTPLGEETFAILDYLERVARIRGWLPDAEQHKQRSNDDALV